MRVAELDALEGVGRGYRVSFERRDGRLLRSDLIPDRAEEPIRSLDDAYRMAERVARTVPNAVNIRPIFADNFTPVQPGWRFNAHPPRGTERLPDAMCHATHWRKHLEEWSGELTVRPYDPEKCTGDGPPWPVWIGRQPAALDLRPAALDRILARAIHEAEPGVEAILKGQHDGPTHEQLTLGELAGRIVDHVRDTIRSRAPALFGSEPEHPDAWVDVADARAVESGRARIGVALMGSPRAASDVAVYFDRP